MTTTSHYEIIATPAGRHLVILDGRQIADCKTAEAAQKVIDRREADLAANTARREESAAEHRAYETETRRLISSLDWTRVRKTVSREPGYSVNCLGSRCEAVLDYWGAPVRTCIVLLVAGADRDGTSPLTSDDLMQLEIDIDSDDETRDLVARHV